MGDDGGAKLGGGHSLQTVLSVICTPLPCESQKETL
jgi:hypothetical protein